MEILAPDFTYTEPPRYVPRDGLSVVVLSFNEAANIERCIQSLHLLSSDIWVVDSQSRDNTVELARKSGAHVVVQPWLGFSRQWNFALQDLPLRHADVMLHASDEQIPEAWAKELQAQLDAPDRPDMVLTRFRFWWMNTPIMHGGYGHTYIVKAGRRPLMVYHEREVNEHIPLHGKIYRMKERYEHNDAKETERWLEKHVKYAQLEARERLRAKTEAALNPKFIGGGQADRVLWIRQNIYDHLPSFIRPLLYFIYRYFFRLGFLDGVRGTYFHILHAFWYPLLIDMFEYQERKKL